MNVDSILENLEKLAESPGGMERIRELVLGLGTQIGFGISLEKSHKRKLCDISHVSWGNLSLTKTSYVEDGSFLAVSAAGPDGRIDQAEHAEFTPVISAIGARCGTMFMPDERFTAIKNTMTVTPNLEVIDNWYLFYALKGSRLPRRGTAQPFLSKKDIDNFEIIVPSSLEEQQVIVDKINELMVLCDQLEQMQQSRDSLRVKTRKSVIDAISTATTPEELEVAWKRINDNWDVIADSIESLNALRELILDLSVRGDLGIENISSEVVPIEWDTDELKLDADKLWQLETLHTNPTKGWSRLPLARLGTWGSGGTPTASRKEFYNNGTIPWAVIGDLNNGIMNETAAKITEKALSSSAAKLIPQNAVLIAMYGASIGKTAVSGIECTTNQAIAHCVVDESVITTEYFFLVAKSLKKHLIKAGKGAAQPNISQTVLKHLLIDVPNLNAQLVVVSKVGQLMELCDQLEAGLMARSELAEKFARSVVSAA